MMLAGGHYDFFGYKAKGFEDHFAAIAIIA
jgi:hypothetical protein